MRKLILPRRKLLIGAASSLICAPAIVRATTMPLTGAGPSGSGVIGPPTFTFQSPAQIDTASSSNVFTWPSVNIGTASSTRFVALLFANAGYPPSAVTINGSASGVTITNLGQDNYYDIDLDVVTAVVTTGTTMSVVWTTPFSGTINLLGCYTSSTSTMISTTPINYGMTTQLSGTGMTQTINVAQSGTALLTGFMGYGVTNGSQAFTTPNDPGIAQDAIDGASLKIGHANSAAANASTRISASWTTSARGYLATVGFR